MNPFLRVRISISLDALLGLLVMIIPVATFFLTTNGNNPFISDVTSFIVLLMSAFLLMVMWVNQRINSPILKIFTLIYIVFWHLRFLTLALFPGDELVLSRTIVIDHDIFNRYVLIVFLSLVATVVGIFVAHVISQPGYLNSIGEARLSVVDLDKVVRRNIHRIFIYCSLSFFYLVCATQISEEFLPSYFGYFSFFFPFGLNVFLVGLVFFGEDVSRTYKRIFFIQIVVYLILTVLTGSRSFLLYVILYGLFLFTILNKSVNIKFLNSVYLLLLGVILVFGFSFGTYQRHVRGVSGMSAGSESIQYVVGRMVNMGADEAWGSMIGMASARAGYLDYSAEMVSNSKYELVVTFGNIIKSAIDGYVPGAVFDDSRLISVRIRDIYNPSADGYQSDAIGVVGENYILFGYAFPFAIFFVSFIFTYLFYAVGGSIFGYYIKFSIAIWFMTWWNSFGYDWLLLDIGRQLIFGLFTLQVIFRHRGANLHDFKLVKTVRKGIMRAHTQC